MYMETTKVADDSTETKTSYELHILLDSAVANTDINALEKKLQEMLEKNGAQNINMGKFVKKQLAYPINKNTIAYSAVISFTSQPNLISNIDAELKISEIIFLRYMITKASKATKRKSIRTKKFISKDIALKEKVDIVSKDTIIEKEQEKPKIKDSVGEDKKVTLDDIDKRLDEIMGNL